MLSFSKIAALGVLSLAALTTAAPKRLDEKNLVARGDKKGDYKVYDYDIDFKEVDLLAVIVEVKKKGQYTSIGSALQRSSECCPRPVQPELTPRHSSSRNGLIQTSSAS